MKNIDLDALRSKDFVMANAYIGLGKAGRWNGVKRLTKFEGTEAYLYVAFPEAAGVYADVPYGWPEDELGIDTDELWKKAEENTFKDAQITDLMEKLMAFGMDFGGGEGISKTYKEHPIYVVTNNRMGGAAAILNRDMVESFAREKGVKSFVVIPASTNEMLLTEYKEGMDMDKLENLIRTVNITEVLEEERLADRPYILNL